VCGEDVFALMSAGAWVREHTTAEQADRLIDFTLSGLATP
jgi:hypothetical protein